MILQSNPYSISKTEAEKKIAEYDKKIANKEKELLREEQRLSKAKDDKYKQI